MSDNDSDIRDTSSSSSESSSESSSDDDLQFFYERERPKNENCFEETVPQYQEEFLEHFRVHRHVAEALADQFENSEYYNHHSGQYGKLSAFQHILIFLWFVGHQTSSFRDVADRFNITISSLFRVIRRVTHFVSNLSPQIIVWPSLLEKNEIEQYFRQKGFPGVVGVIDGSHIKIDKPSNDPESYINRKGYYSIQLQAVCDHNMRIRDVYVGYPGSVHDSRVLRNSPLAQNLQEKCLNMYILGDSGYPLLPNLLTPFKDWGHLTRPQRNYNLKLAQNRYIIEHCFGLLKQKFRQLYHVKLRSITDIVHLIRACCVLHNLALQDKFELQDTYEGNVEFPLPQLEVMENEEDERDDQTGQERRHEVVRMLPY